MLFCSFLLEIVEKEQKGEKTLKNLTNFLKNIRTLTFAVGISSLLLTGCVGSLGSWTNSDCPPFPYPSENVIDKLEEQAQSDEEFADWLGRITAHGEKIDVCRGEEE
jgi:hypothetical protein